MRPSGPFGPFGLLRDWRGRTQYCILDTDFAQGQPFLQTWLAWQNDADIDAQGQQQRPHILHCVALCEHSPVLAQTPPTAPHSSAHSALAVQLHQALANHSAAAHDHRPAGLAPGLHRLRFAQGRVLLTLCIGPLHSMLRKLVCEADCLRLPSAAEPSTDTLKALARHCRRGSLLWCGLDFGLDFCSDHGSGFGLDLGFVAHKQAAPARRLRSARPDEPQAAALENPPPPPPPLLQARLGALGFQAGTGGDGVYDPPWQLKRLALPRTQPTQALVVGAGLAGAAVAASLAQRGWQVQVLDAAATPATGASSLPVGLLVPHVSADDALLSRASRAGLQATLQACRQHLREGQDWQATPALREGLRIAQAAWVKPAALVQAWLAHRAIHFSGGQTVARLRYASSSTDSAAPGTDEPNGAVLDAVLDAALGTVLGTGSAPSAAGQWQALDAQGRVLAQAPVLVLCTAWAVGHLLPAVPALPASLGAANPPSPAPALLPLDQVAGQVAYGPWSAALERAAPLLPWSGHGHFIPRVTGPVTDTAMEGAFWLSGSTYERAPLDALDATLGLRANHQRLATLLQPQHPQANALLSAQFAAQAVQHWAGQRCTSRDRLPLAGPWHSAYPGLYVSTAMGSRGLSFAALCAELIAAHLHGEPLAVEAQVAQAMACSRF